MKAASLTRTALGIAALFTAGTVCAQAGKGPAQVVKPPVSQAWIDVATFAGFGMPAGGGASSPMSMMGGMFGGGQCGGRNTFGMTQTGSTGRWVDVTLYTSRNPTLVEGTQAVPAGTQLAPTLKLVEDPVILPTHIQEAIEERGKFRTICDYIAGMTDRFAIEEHQRLFDPVFRP